MKKFAAWIVHGLIVLVDNVCKPVLWPCNMKDDDGVLDALSVLLRLTDEEGALPYDHSVIFPYKPPSDAESSVLKLVK